MKMTALEKRFVNDPGHARKVAGRARQMLERIGPEAGWRYLDVGCGTGAAAREISGGGLEVTGVDVDPKQIEAARGAGEGRNLRFRVMDATALDFGDGEFDIVATSMATHHIPDWERAFSEMVRVLRPGGYLIYSDHVFPAWLARIVRFVRFIRFPTRAALDAVIARSKLSEVYAARKSRRVDAIWLKTA